MKKNNIEILFEDNHLIAVNKRPSDIVQGDKTGDIPLSEMVKELIKEKNNKPGNVFLGVTHRIDRPVSGVILFAKTSKALARLNEMFQNKSIQKTYWAVVKNKPAKAEDKLLHFLAKNEKNNKSFVTDEKRGKKSELTYKYLSSSDHYHLLEITPHTGRHHQIRVQLSSINSPIKGDLKYGFDRPNKGGFIHLHAKKIEFIHPVKLEKIVIEASPPDDPVWNFFNKENKQ